MTAPRFCMTCGSELEPGARFCRSCGTAVTAEPSAAEELVCRNCGTQLQPGRRFCTTCGTPVDGNAPVAPRATDSVAGIPRDKLPLALGGVVALVIIAVLALTTLGGDDGDGSGPSGFSDSGGSGASSGGELNPDIGIAEFPEPIPVDLPEGGSLLGPDNRPASAAVRAFLADSGLDLAGVDVFVFPIANVGESMLVLAADFETFTALDSTSSDTGEDASDDVFVRMMELPEVEAANLTRVTMNLSGDDAEGHFVVTITLPIEALDPNNPEFADLTEEQALEVFKVQVSR